MLPFFEHDGFVDLDLFRNMQTQKEGTVEFYLGEGFTSEEEDEEVKRVMRFYESFPGYPRTHTLKVVYDDGSGRPPYYVHIDDIGME
jgi:hypothetical protein